jgi:cardiolipin synthase A/B
VSHFRNPPGGLAQPRAPSLVSLTEARPCDKATAALVQESLVWDTLVTYWREITASAALIDAVLIAITIPWALRIKKDATSALAWCLLVLFVPLLGAILFVLLGYQSVDRPLARKKKHRQSYRGQAKKDAAAVKAAGLEELDTTWEGIGRLADRLDAYPLTSGNKVEVFNEGQPFFDALFEAIHSAKDHIHIEIYIFGFDDVGRKVLAVLEEKAKSGVKVRLVYDAVGTRTLGWWRLRRFRRAGGRAAAFLPVSIVKRRLRVNLRNHRKIIVIDGRIAFTGGMNIGDDYADKGPLGHWRDTMLQIEGPAVASLQATFAEDWNFASGELLDEDAFKPCEKRVGDVQLQVIQSGPDLDLKAIREIYFAAALKARHKLWITTPYYVPDAGLRDALCLVGRSGIDVKLLLPQNADHFHVHYASRYYLPELLDAGVDVYLYKKGFIHSKVWIADGHWASVGTANLDNRSLFLNFEVNCMIYTPKVIAELEQAFERDLLDSIRLDPQTYAQRPWTEKLAENFCRLFSPIL